MQMKRQLIIFPTDTVYGIGCSIYDLENIDKIYKLKNRARNKPLPCLCADLNQIEEVADLTEKERIIIENFMPGALTLIVKSKEEISKITGFNSIGVRIPNSATCIRLLSENGPMLTTSVNDSGAIPLNDYGQINSVYKNLVDLILPPNGESSNLASTVLQIVGGDINLIREGDIKLEDIKKLLAECQ